MSLLKRTGRQGAGDRGRLRRRLREIGERREEMVRDLGGLALEMHRRDRFDAGLLSEKAAEVAALDAESKLLRRALEEGLTSGELDELGDTGSKLGAAGSQPQ